MVCWREGGAPVGGGGGGGGRPAPEGENGGLPMGRGGAARMSGESPGISSEARKELRFAGGKADGDLGEAAAVPGPVSEISSPDSDPGLGERIGGWGGTGRAAMISHCSHYITMCILTWLWYRWSSPTITNLLCVRDGRRYRSPYDIVSVFF